MNQQYFSSKPDSRRRPREVEVVLDGDRLSFTTDAGVFSPGRLDLGSATLLALAPPADADRTHARWLEAVDRSRAWSTA